MTKQTITVEDLKRAVDRNYTTMDHLKDLLPRASDRVLLDFRNTLQPDPKISQDSESNCTRLSASWYADGLAAVELAKRGVVCGVTKSGRNRIA